MIERNQDIVPRLLILLIIFLLILLLLSEIRPTIIQPIPAESLESSLSAVKKSLSHTNLSVQVPSKPDSPVPELSAHEQSKVNTHPDSNTLSEDKSHAPKTQPSHDQSEHYSPYLFQHLQVDQVINLIRPDTLESLPAKVTSVSPVINGQTLIIAGNLTLSDGAITPFTIVSDAEISTIILRTGSGVTWRIQTDNETGQQLDLIEESEVVTEKEQQTIEADENIETTAYDGLADKERRRFIPSPSTSRESFP